MNYDDLLEMLEIEEPYEFKFFENFADLVECDQRISYDALFELISKVDKIILAEVIESYFDDAAEALPDDGTEAFTFLKTLSLSLRGMLKPLLGNNREEEQNRSLVTFVEELEKFRQWYVIDSNVECTRKKDGQSKEVPFLEALVLSRLEKLNQEEYSYGFDEALNYHLEEYVVSFGDVIEEEEGFIEEDLEANPQAEYMSGLSEDEYDF